MKITEIAPIITIVGHHEASEALSWPQTPIMLVLGHRLDCIPSVVTEGQVKPSSSQKLTLIW